MKYILIVLLLLVWIYTLIVTEKTKLLFWHYAVGSGGLFILMMIVVRPLLTKPLSYAVAAMAGLIGGLTHTFEPYFKYGILFVESAKGAITMQIDFECSGIIEIMAFLALLLFFKVYSLKERIALSFIGTLYIMVSNAFRIIVICEIIHIVGPSAYHMAHTLIGRILFYVLTIVLYFYVFTKPQIVRMKLGRFSYGKH